MNVKAMHPIISSLLLQIKNVNLTVTQKKKEGQHKSVGFIFWTINIVVH